jgi:hypothetical protein
VNGQIEYLLRCALKDAGRLPHGDGHDESESTGARKKRGR